MKRILFPLLIILLIGITGCTENYSNGERIGLVPQFSRKGFIFKTWEGQLNLTQTGMNSSGTSAFPFSIDRDVEDQKVVQTIDSAATYGWKVKLIYHEVLGWNWFSNRGSTDHFIVKVDVLDRNPVGNIFGNNRNGSSGGLPGSTDTIYVVIVNKNRLKW
jgi:hypothetical protein